MIVGAQSRTDSTFTDLRPDGNGIAALRTTIRAGFIGQRANDAIRAIADQARLNITFDPQLPELRATLTIPAHDRTAAVALLEVARETRLRVRISREGQIVVARSPVVAAQPGGRDTLAPGTLPPVRTTAERAERQEFLVTTGVGKVSITGSEVRSAPVFVEPDVLRSAQMLPGIAARSDYAAGFNVRGGESDQNLILIDGYPIFSPFHMYGLFSTFIDPAVGRVNVHTGALPARFAGRLSGVLSVESADATSSKLRGTTEVSLVSSNASLGRTFRGGEGSWMIAARRTYADAVVNMVRHGTIPYHFGDLQAHLETPLVGGVRISATAYKGLDVVTRQADDSSAFTGAWGNRVIGATLSKTVAGVLGADSLTFAQRVSSTVYDIHAEIPPALFHVTNRVTDARTGGSVTLHRRRWTNEVGYELTSGRASYLAKGPPGAGFLMDLIPFDSLELRSRTAGVYGDAIWRPSSSLIVDGGLRVDALDGGRGSLVLPRMSVKYFLTRDVAFTAAAGRYSQWLHSMGREEEMIQPFQFWVSSAASPSVSRDAVVGGERWITSSRVLHVEAFHKHYERLLVPNIAHEEDVSGDEFIPVTGTSYGADVLLRQLDGGGPFSGWLAYTYTLSSRVTADGVHYFPSQDRRHNLNLVGSWTKGGGKYALGARLHLASGTPYTPFIGAFARLAYDPTTKKWIEDRTEQTNQSIAGPRNSKRVPMYHRLDASVRRYGRIRGASVEPYLSLVNLFNAKNVAGYFEEYDHTPERTTFPNLPFIPTFGVRIGY